MEQFNLKSTILQEHSKAQCNKIVEWIGYDQTRFDELFNLFLKDDYQVTQRAAWPVSFCINHHPEFIKKQFGALVNNLHKPGIHNAVKRNTLHILQGIEIPEKYQGEVMNLCFQYVESPTEAIATKAYSLTVLGNLAKLYPEILPEIKLMIDKQLPNQRAAFKSRAKRLLKSIEKL